MPTYIAPGVYSEEIDLSLYTPQISTSILGLVGGFRKGPVNRITFISDRSQFEQIFGTPLRGEIGFAAHAALYFLRWGHQLKIVRVGTSALARARVEVFDNTLALESMGFIRGVTEGDWANGIQVVIASHLIPTEEDPNITETVYNVHVFDADAGRLDLSGNVRFDGFAPLETFQNVVFNDSADIRYVEKILNGNSQYIIFDLEEEGLTPNLYGASTARPGTIFSSGTTVTGIPGTLITSTQFTKTLRVGDKITNISSILHPAVQTRTVTKITSDSSIMIDAAFVPDLPATTTYTAATVLVHVVGGALLDEGNDGTALLQASDVIGTFTPSTGVATGIRAFEDPLVEDINLLSAPGWNHDRVVADFLITTAQTRFDCLAVLDTPDLKSSQDMRDYIEGSLGTPGNSYSNFAPLTSSNRAAIYGPWVKIFDAYNNEEIYVPASVRTLGIFAYNDAVAFPWYAAAGANRGLLFNTLDVRFRLTLGDVENIYGFGVNCNPIQVTVDGILINGNKTLQRKPSLLQNIHIVRMLMYAEKVIATATRYLQWEPHDPITWRRYINLVEPFLHEIVAKRGITEFKVKCDAETNTAYYINQGMMVAELHIIPTTAVAVIVNRYIIHAHGATLEANS